MHNLGKITGVIFALMISAGFWGIILGLIIGHMFDTVHSQNITWFSNPQQKYQTFFLVTIFEVMGHITKSKGRVTEKDICIANQLMDQMNLRKEFREIARNAFRTGKSRNYPLRERMHQFRSMYFGRFDLIKMFLEMQIQAAFSDNFIHPREREVLYVISEELGISRSQFDEILRTMKKEDDMQFKSSYQYYSNASRQHRKTKSSLKDAYNTLGIKITDEVTTIKRAYRRLMSVYHPDKLAAKGLSPEMKEMAKKKAQDIQKAYEMIKNQRRFK